MAGQLWGWGNNGFGQLADNTSVNKSSPVQTIAFGTDWSSLFAGFFHVGAIKTDKTLWTWGRNSYGQLGDNTITHRSSPVQTVAGGNNWNVISCGVQNTACIKTDGTLWLWGRNSYGGLGDNTTTNKSSPIQTVAGGSNWISVACGLGHTAAIKADGTLWTWGRNFHGQLGDNTTTNKSSPIQTITGGNYCSCMWV
jgi:alpha-tubulin suppressor-like RCC1 family protein